MSVSSILGGAILALALGGLAGAVAGRSESPPQGPFAEDFSLLTPAVPAPPEAFQDLDGGRVRLTDFEGGVVLLNFWATWCAPCIREMPALDRLQSILGAEGLSVAAVSIDRAGKDVVAPFAEKLGLKNLGLYLDPKSALARAFGISGLPATFLIDKRGRIARALLGPAEWDSHAAVTLIRHYLEKPGGKRRNAGAGSSIQ